jgi:hypothetical protein
MAVDGRLPFAGIEPSPRKKKERKGKKNEIDKDVIRTRAAEAIRLAGEPLHHSGTLPYDIITLFIDL